MSADLPKRNPDGSWTYAEDIYWLKTSVSTPEAAMEAINAPPRRTPEEIAAIDKIVGIKQVAGERIYQIAPLHKQLNALAAGVALLHGAVLKAGVKFDADEQAQVDSLMKLQEDISDIRAKSDDIEKMVPLPESITDDKLWKE